MYRSGLIVLAAVLVCGCSGESGSSSVTSIDVAPLTVTELRLPQPFAGMRMGAGYLTLSNNSDQDMRITRISSAELEAVEMHESILEDGVSRMKKLPEVVIPAGQSVSFEPGAKHLMLTYPETVPDQVSLRFFSGDDLLLSVATTVAKD